MSGPVSAFSGVYNSDRYLFFGDVHFSMDTNHVKSKTKIIYAGAKHIDTYVNFFEEYLKTPFYKYGSSTESIMKKGTINRCLDININNFL